MYRNNENLFNWGYFLVSENTLVVHRELDQNDCLEVEMKAEDGNTYGSSGTLVYAYGEVLAFKPSEYID